MNIHEELNPVRNFIKDDMMRGFGLGISNGVNILDKGSG